MGMRLVAKPGSPQLDIEMLRRMAQHDTDIQRLWRELQAYVPAAPGGGASSPYGEPRYGRSVAVVMDAPLYRTISAVGSVYTWNATAGDYRDTGDNITVYGTWLTGYFFAGDYLEAQWAPEPIERWYGRGCGQTRIRGVLDGALASQGTATLSVYNWTSGAWADSGVDVTVRNSLALAASIALGKTIHAMWHEQAQQWLEDGYSCA